VRDVGTGDVAGALAVQARLLQARARLAEPPVHSEQRPGGRGAEAGDPGDPPERGDGRPRAEAAEQEAGTTTHAASDSIEVRALMASLTGR
jgi:hypothetical protein